MFTILEPIKQTKNTDQFRAIYTITTLHIGQRLEQNTLKQRLKFLIQTRKRDTN